MSRPKLSDNQVRVLRVLAHGGCISVTYVLVDQTGSPEGPVHGNTLGSLIHHGWIVTPSHDCFRWVITDVGRQALAEHERRAKETS